MAVKELKEAATAFVAWKIERARDPHSDAETAAFDAWFAARELAFQSMPESGTRKSILQAERIIHRLAVNQMAERIAKGS